MDTRTRNSLMVIWIWACRGDEHFGHLMRRKYFQTRLHSDFKYYILLYEYWLACVLSRKIVPKSTSNCTYSKIDTIHHIKIHTNTRQTVEDLFDIFAQVLEESPSSKLNVQYLLDATECGDLSLRYIAQRTQKWNKDHPDAPKARTAILYPMGLFSSMVNVLIKQLSADSQARLFRPDEFDSAIAWLGS